MFITPQRQIKVSFSSIFVLLALIVALVTVPTGYVSAQDDGKLNTVSFNGFSFQYQSTFANGVNIWQRAADSPDLEQPGGPEPKHTYFQFYKSLPAPESAFEGLGTIYVYQVADLKGYNFYEQRVADLQKLLADKTDPATLMAVDTSKDTSLPFLPVYPAGQVLRSRVQYIETAAIKGIVFVTAFRQDVSPLMGNELLYTFQGISTDGTQYVSAVYHVNANMFPQEMPQNFDYDAFSKNFSQYLTESVDKLNKATPTDFTPSLADLDAQIQSFAFGK